MRTVYLDHAAATPIDPRVVEVMLPYLGSEFGNPSALYRQGLRAKEAMGAARKKIADIFACNADEIVFTGSGTESDNLAVLGLARAYASHGKHVIASTFEHHAVLNAVEHLKKTGWHTTLVPVDELGLVDPKNLARAITEETTVVSIMYANNEIGTIQPLKELVKVVRDWKKDHGRGPLLPPFFHTDACQAAGYLDLDVRKLGVDAMTINGSKIYGPKGAGALYLRRGIRPEPLIFGGGQENRLRSGTENVAGIVGLGAALEIASALCEVESVRLTSLREKLVAGIMASVPKVVINGHPSERLPNNVNVSFLDIEGEDVLLYLDAKGIAAATGSACDSASLDPSHVILALGRPYEYAHGSIRFSLGRSTTDEDIDYVLDVLPPIVETLRSISPVKLDYGNQGADTARAFVSLGRPHWERKN